MNPSPNDIFEGKLALGVNDACAALGDISRSTFYNLLKRGELRECHIAGRRVVLVTDLKDLLARHRFDVRISALSARRPHGQMRLRLTEHQFDQLLRYAERL